MKPRPYILEIPKREVPNRPLSQPERDAAAFFVNALTDPLGTFFVASPYWSSPNVLLQALEQVQTWTKRFPQTSLAVSTQNAASRVLRDLEAYLPWRPSIYVCSALHAKIAIRECRGRIAVLVGSANMTAAAQRRIEVMVALHFESGPEAAFLVGLRETITASSTRFLAHAPSERRKQ
jgi:hypothetical protein